MTVMEWIREIFATIFFFTSMGVICFALLVFFPDPLLWSPR